MHFPRCLARTIPAVALACPALAGQEGSAIPFAKLAEDLLDRAGLEDASPDLFDAHQFLGQRYLTVRLGLFHVAIPRASAEDKAHAKDCAKLLGTLLDLQLQWVDWLAPALPAELRDATVADLRELQGWAKGVRGDALARVASADTFELLDALGAKEKVLAAAERLAGNLGRGRLLGLEHDDRPEWIVLAPTRQDFVEHAALAGWVYPELRGTYWGAGVATWTQFYMDDISVFALEFAQSSASWRLGSSMNEREPRGMEQQVAQLAANSLVDSVFGARIPPSLAGALAVNLTIDIFGECETRADGDLRARRTEAYEMFVPGGASEGGVLAPNSALSRWREEQGADGFASVLQDAQRAGTKANKRSGGGPRHFELQDDEKIQRMVVSAPFLGAAAAASEPRIPAIFEGDWQEFLRAYRSGFVYWLRREAAGKAAESRVAFARFLVELASAEELDLESALASSFQRGALSSAELGDETLEGRFLAWLAKR